VASKPRIRVNQHNVVTGYMLDGLANLMSGSGTTLDARTNNRWLRNIINEYETENAYRGSWLMRKIIDLPAYDQTRAWRDWQASGDQIEKLEDEEERLRVKEKIRIGIIMGRLGGGALIMGTGDTLGNGGDLTTPLDPTKITVGGLRYLFAASRFMLKPGELITDPADDDFGEPELFELTLPGAAKSIDVHHSRMLIFKGQFTGMLTARNRGQLDYWGDSVISSVMEAVNNATTAQNEFAALIAQAKIDVYMIPDLMQKVGQPDYEARFMRRLQLADQGKSNHRALIMDANEKWEQRQLTLSGMSDLMRAFIAIVAGAADIPATRLLGKSPDGMNATGDSDQSNYEQMIKTKQENDLRPILEKLDNVLIPSALGQQPNAKPASAANDDSDTDDVDEDEDVYWEFAPLSVLGESDQAEIEFKESQTLKNLFDTGMFQDEALEEAFSNRMIESDRWPGYEKARKEALKAPKPQPSPRDIIGVETPGEPPADEGGTGTGAGVTVTIKAGKGGTGGPPAAASSGRPA
jgi:uncharacterized protein